MAWIRATALEPFPSQPEDVTRLIEKSRLSWLLNSEMFSLLKRHKELGLYINDVAPYRPRGGTLFLIDKEECRRFRNDGHTWRKKKDGKVVNEAHEKLKVGNSKRLNCTYATAEDLPLQRRCYSLLDCKEHEHVVLVHYLNSDAPDRSPSSRDSASHSTDSAALAAPGTAAADTVQAAADSELALAVSPHQQASTSTTMPPHLPCPAAAALLAVLAGCGMLSSAPGCGTGGMQSGSALASGRLMAGAATWDLQAPQLTPLLQEHQQQQQQFPAQFDRRSPRKRASPDEQHSEQGQHHCVKRVASSLVHQLSERELLHLSNKKVSLAPASLGIAPRVRVADLHQVPPCPEPKGQGLGQWTGLPLEHPDLLLELDSPKGFELLLWEELDLGSGMQPEQHASRARRPTRLLEQQREEREAAVDAQGDSAEHSAEHSTDGNGSGGRCSSWLLSTADPASAWLAPVLPTLCDADDGSVPDLPHWVPDIPLDGPIELEGLRMGLGEAKEGNSQTAT